MTRSTGVYISGNWAQTETSGAKVSDRRHLRVLAETVEAVHAQPDVSFSSATGDALRQAAGRFLRHEDTTPDGLLAGHRQATLERSRDFPLIVVAQDSTSYSFTTHSATVGLGPVNDSATATGIHQHAALAMTEDKLPLGVVHSKFWTRPPEGRSSERRRDVPIEEKESFKWLETVRRTEDLYASHLEGGGRVVVAGDRESDVFDLMAMPRRAGMELLIRAVHQRKVEVCHTGTVCTVLDAARSGQALGRYGLAVPSRPAKGGRPARRARTALMELRSAYVLVQPPQNGVGHGDKPVPAWVVTTREVPGGGSEEELVDWTLITTMDASNAEAARRAVNLYTCRWQIERLHYTLKSGCRAERLQMDDAATLCNTLALYMIVAWRLLFMTHVARVDPDAPANALVDETEMAVLAQRTGKPVTTAAQVIVAVAKLAGFAHYRNGPPPGVKTIWSGLRKLEAMAEGWRLAMDFKRLEKCESR